MDSLAPEHPAVLSYMERGSCSVQAGPNNPIGSIPVNQVVEETVYKDTQTAGGTNGFSLKPVVFAINISPQICPHIQDCATRQCTTQSNTKCLNCTGDKVFFKTSPDRTKCQRMCAGNNHYCWPGTCGDELIENCKCDPGFRIVKHDRETSCQPTTVPTLLTCHTIVTGQNGKMKRTTGSACDSLTDFYGNFQPAYITFNMTSDFTVNIKTAPYPKFIEESNFGITDTTVYIQKQDIAGTNTVLRTHDQLVDSTNGANAVSPTSSSQKLDTYNYRLINGERLCLVYEALGGGFLRSKDTVRNTVSAHVSYQKTKTSRTLCYRYDDAAPVHCMHTGTCRQEPLQIEHRITRAQLILVEFNGWTDPIPPKGTTEHASGIESYQVTVNEVTASNGNLNVNTGTGFTKKANNTDTSMTLNVTSDSPKLYCITLEVKDVADNVKKARQFVLYDDTSNITVRSDKTFTITSASTETNYTWQTHHNDICLNWKDYFFNKFYFDNPLLNPIEPDPFGLISGVYEQTSGLLPLSGTPNVNGIVKYMVSWNLNDGPISKEMSVPNFLNQSFCRNFSVQDGETYTLNIRPTDIATNTYTENRTVHIDRSVPHINTMSIQKDNYTRLKVDESTYLFQMMIHFEALDYHSGIGNVEWTFGLYDKGTEISKGVLHVRTMLKNECKPGSIDCYCPEVGMCEMFTYTARPHTLVKINTTQGVHNETYIFTVTATNHALLSSIEHMDILLDNSPVETVVVNEDEVEKTSLASVIGGSAGGGLIIVSIVIFVVIILLRRRSSTPTSSENTYESPIDCNTEKVYDTIKNDHVRTGGTVSKDGNTCADAVYENLKLSVF